MTTAAPTDPTVGTIGATPVLFFPVPTPWPMSAGCDKHIYRQNNKGSILAWDPEYTRIGGSASVEKGESCFPTQQRSWHYQAATATPSTALGPTFVCPESFSAVFSTLVESNTASRTEYTYCCPPKFTLNALLPQNQRSAVQCTSMLPVGSTLSFISVTFTPTVVSSTTTNVIAYLPSSTVVTSTAETVFAAPLNGYNILAVQRPTDTGTGGPATTDPSGAGTTGQPGGSSESGSSGGTSAGTIAGAVVGGVAALALGIALVFFLLKRRSRKAGAGAGGPPPPAVEVAGDGGLPPQAYHAASAYGKPDGSYLPYYGGTPGSTATTAVPEHEMRHELPSQGQRFELSGGQEGPGGGGYRA